MGIGMSKKLFDYAKKLTTNRNPLSIYRDTNSLIATKKLPFKYVNYWRKTQSADRSLFDKILIWYYNLVK